MNVYGRGALDPRWTRHHTDVVASFMLATIKVIRKIPGASLVYNQETQTYTGGFETVLENVKARIQPYGIIGDMVVGQDTTGRRLLRVQMEGVQSAVHLDDMLIVTASPEAPELMDYTIEVRGAISSSNPWVTDLVCEADLKAAT
jgi:hypothetical protein